MTPPPAWFSAALDAAVQEGTTTVDGASIAYRAWGDPDGRSIVLVHGGAAHSRWWDHIAPMLTEGWRVVAVDLSGHGDSDRRDRYSLDTWGSRGARGRGRGRDHRRVRGHRAQHGRPGHAAARHPGGVGD